MNQKEAIELVLKLHTECEKHINCRNCPFWLEGLDIRICKEDEVKCVGFETLTESLRQLDSICVLSDKVTDKVSENVNSPSHYCKGGLECIEAIRAACEGLEGVEAYYVGNVIKYVWRFKGKNGIEDLKKARKYLDWLIDQEEKESETKM